MPKIRRKRKMWIEFGTFIASYTIIAVMGIFIIEDVIKSDSLRTKGLLGVALVSVALLGSLLTMSIVEKKLGENSNG